MSRIFAYTAEAFRSIWLNRFRSVLTMLGMIIGTSSVIAVLGISHAASSGINGTLNSLGVQPVQVNVDQDQDDPAAAALQYRDVATLEDALQGSVTAVEPTYLQPWQISGNRQHQYATVFSGSGYHLDSLTMRAGRRLRDEDVAGSAHVAAISLDLAEKYFGSAPAAIGSTLTIDGTRFRVIGVYDPLKGSLFNAGGQGTFVEIPFSTFHHMRPGPLDSIQFYPISADRTDEVSAAAVRVLQHIHGAHTKYVTQNSSAQINGFESVINIVAAGLTAIGAVALVVAGIGIMNIMLVSVTERTREIGIRKSIGASRGDIALQFLMEALLLAFGGGLTGMLIGVLGTLGMVTIVSRTLGESQIPYLLIVAVAMGFSVTVGIVFGSYPAFRAARMDPIEALRS